MSRIRLFTALLAICLTAGCKAQSVSSAPFDPAVARHIEIMVRAEYNVPPDCTVTLGARKPSFVPGYDGITVTIAREGKSTAVDFLIATDNSTLARLETFDLKKNPAFNIDVTGRPIRGNPAAKVTVVNFDDLECPFCARLHQELFPGTLERYKDKVRFIYKDNPLPPDMHPWAMHAAVDAGCLAAQSSDVYWTYVDYLHSHGDEVTGDTPNLPKSLDALNRIARQEATLAKLDPAKLAKLNACIDRQDETSVRESLKEADTLKIEGAPAVFVNGERFDGAQPEPLVWMTIDRALRAAGETPPPAPASPASAPSPAPATAPAPAPAATKPAPTAGTGN